MTSYGPASLIPDAENAMFVAVWKTCEEESWTCQNFPRLVLLQTMCTSKFCQKPFIISFQFSLVFLEGVFHKVNKQRKSEKVRLIEKNEIGNN